MCVEQPFEIPRALVALGVPAPRPVLVLIGGAANLDPVLAGPLLGLLEFLVPALEGAGAAVIDGATASGVMALMGQARSRAGARFPLVGIAASGTVDVPLLPVDGPTGTAALDPHHSHFVLVPGRHWGDESPWISACAGVLAGPRSSLTLVAAGGPVTRRDVAHGLAARRPLLAIAGSGGTADLVAAWSQGGEVPREMAVDMDLDSADRTLVRVLDLADPTAVRDLVSGLLGS